MKRVFVLTLLFSLLTSCSQFYRERSARNELLKRQIDISTTSLLACTKIKNSDCASLFNDIEFFKNISSDDFETLLKHTATYQNAHLSEALNTANKNYEYPSRELSIALLEAVDRGNKSIVLLLIRHGARPYIGDQDLLYRAVHHDDYDLISILIANGATTDRGKNLTAITHAAYIEKFNSVKALMDSQKIPKKYQQLAASSAAIKKNMDILKYLISKDVDLNQGEPGGCPPLIYLAREGTLEMVKYLVEHGANVNIRCGKSHPLGMAHAGNKIDIIKYLVEHGATES